MRIRPANAMLYLALFLPASKTGADGSFKISNLQPGKLVLVVIDPRTLVNVALDLELTGDQEIVVDLTTGALKGRLVAAASGVPIANAIVAVDPATPGHGMALDRPTATTDKNGIFAIPNLVTGLYRVTASPPGFSPKQVTVKVAPHTTATVDLELAAVKAASP